MERLMKIKFDKKLRLKLKKLIQNIKIKFMTSSLINNKYKRFI